MKIIDLFFEKLKAHLGLNRLRKDLDLVLWKTGNADALIQLQQLSPKDSFIPFTHWSMPPILILHILNDIIINSRKNIVEFGSGASTLYIARLIRAQKLECKLIAVESDKGWLQKMNDILA